MPKPVAVFLRQSLELRASAAACREESKPKPVHKLRASTRRLEATLDLLAKTAKISGLRKQSELLRKSLRRIRRAAGKVRDLDVLSELASGYKGTEADHLKKQLQDARDKSAEKLQRRIEKDSLKMQQALDDLETALAPALDIELSGGELAARSRSLFTKAVHHLDPQKDEQLHEIRKACKTSRYVAEIGGESSKKAAATAARFEDAQQTLGQWHDHLLLLEEARSDTNGHGHALQDIESDTERLRERAISKAKSVVGRT